jgi:carboxyl-terminal processing protease
MRSRVFIAGLALVLSGCIFQSSPNTTTATTTPPDVVTTVAANGRQVEIVECGDAPSDAEILCEGYTLIKDRYVDRVADEALAQGASEGLDLLDGAQSDGPITCAVPNDAFTEACLDAAEQAEDTAEAAEAMLFGMASLALDPHSAYIDPDLLQLIRDETDGRVEGIGALVIAEDASGSETQRCVIVTETCRLVIVSPIPGSPAEAAGIQHDDEIVGVDGRDIAGLSIEEVTGMVRGPAGTDVVLTMRRDGEEFDLRITRAAVDVPVITSELFGDTGYVRLSQFTDAGGDQMQEALFELMTNGMEHLVLDLRDNPGGLLTTAIEVASEFLPDGDVVRTIGRDESESYQVLGNAIVPEDIEVTVIVNQGSASASELLAALLQERGRAKIFGENTFGKNTVQTQFGLANGGALKLSIARWVTPGGLDFGEVGVTPDIEAEFPADLTPRQVVNKAIDLRQGA